MESQITNVNLGMIGSPGGPASCGIPLIQDANDPNFGLIDTRWAASPQAAQALRFCQDLHTDGNGQSWRVDSAVPLSRDLNYVLAYVRDNYRPLKYASILQSISVPDWAERWEISKIVGNGKVALGSQLGQRDVPRPDFDRSTTTGRMFEVVNGYGYTNREMIRAAKLGINPQTERAMIQAQAAEEFLDALCATGLAGTAYADFGLGLTGLGNDTDVDDSLVTASTKASTTTSWTTAVAADFALILDDLHNGLSKVYTQSNEKHQADTIVMPLDEFNALNRLRPSNYAANVLDTFKQEWQARIGKPGRIFVWDRFAALGTISSGPRIAFLNASDVNVACYVTGKPYGVDQVLEVTRGFEVNCSMVCGGVRMLDKSGMAYLDIAA